MVIQSSGSNQIGTKPFNPFVILSSYNQRILFFTQTFAQLSGFHPSTVPSYIPMPVQDRLNLDIQHSEKIDNYQIFHFKEENSFHYRNSCIDALIHELRTASLAIDLGAHVLAENEQLTPLLRKLLLQKLRRSAHRQKVSTLIASDFIQLVTSTPIIYPTSVTKLLTDSLSHSPAKSQVKLHFVSAINDNILGYVNPNIWGNFHYLSNFLTTLISWLESEPFTVEMEVINPVSVQISLTILPDRFLSNIQGFSLIPHYLHYIAAYFNGRAWVTQTSINILFPLVFSDLSS